MERFYVTFGSQYGHEPHPHDARVHPDGWFVVEAEDEMQARKILFAHMSDSWSMIYTEDEWLENWAQDKGYYTRGELARLSVDEPPC